MAGRTLKSLVPSTPSALGMVRAGVHGFFLLAVLVTPFSANGRLPVTTMRPTGAMQLLSWRFYDALLTPGGMSLLKYLMLASLLMSAAGFLTSLTTKSSALLVILYQGLLRSLNHFNHDEMLGVYVLVVLAFSPCGDAFSVDSRFKDRGARRPAWAYGYPILLCRVLVAWAYFSSALIKLRVDGFGYLSSDTLHGLAVAHSLDNLHQTQFRLAFNLHSWGAYLTPLVALALVWELLFPLAILSKRGRPFILGAGVIFHLSTLFFMNIFFPVHLAMYLVFVDWPALTARISRTAFIARLSGARREGMSGLSSTDEGRRLSSGS
jgi:hypothetical protein